MRSTFTSTFRLWDGELLSRSIYVRTSSYWTRGSIITGSSVHNCRVERSYRDIFCGVLTFYALIFKELENDGYLDVLNEVYIFCLHYIFLPRMQRSLDEFVQQMNHRPVSTENNQTPI